MKTSLLVATFLALAFGQPALAETPALPKKVVDQFLAPACSKIEAEVQGHASQKIWKTTQYYIPLFTPGPDGKLRPEDRRSCLKMEGSCVVGDYLYNYPSDVGVSRATVAYKFGEGTDKGTFNTTDALDPCRTVAADKSVYPIGTVIFSPDMKGKTCPQTKKPVDGCFIVGDVGSAIRGKGRFDMFTGECAQYKNSVSTCIEPGHDQFGLSEGSKFYVIDRNAPLAAQLRGETDAFILRDWRAGN